MSGEWLAVAVWAPFAVLAVLVLAGFAVSASFSRRAERRQLGNRPEALDPPPSSPPPPQPVEAQPSPPSPPPPPPSPSNAQLRRWAKSAGLRVADRGPIPAQVREAWSRAHGTSPDAG